MDYFLANEAQRKLRRWWAPLAIVNVALLVLQTVMGQYATIAVTAWFWLLLAIVPASVLLFWGRPRKKRASNRLVEKGRVRSLLGLIVVYLLLVLTTNVLSQAAVNASDLGLRGYLWRSFLWLLPLNAFTILHIWTPFFAPEKKVQANAKIIQKYAEELATKVNEAVHPIRKQCLHLLAQNETVAAFDVLNRHYQLTKPVSEQSINNLIVLRSQYTGLQESIQ
ncbi:MAG: hypothetical protein AAFY48_20050, partial [Bacteroidota bacterium]